MGDSGEAASGYYSAPWQWDRIRENQEWIAIYHSTDDPHIPAAEPRFVAKQLKCSYFEFDDRGHFVDARALPEVVPFLKTEARKIDHAQLADRIGGGRGHRLRREPCRRGPRA